MLRTTTIDTFGFAEEKRIQKDTNAILAQFRKEVDDLICQHLESISDRSVRYTVSRYFACILEDAETLRSEENVVYRDALTDEEEEEAVRRHPW